MIALTNCIPRLVKSSSAALQYIWQAGPEQSSWSAVLLTPWEVTSPICHQTHCVNRHQERCVSSRLLPAFAKVVQKRCLCLVTSLPDTILMVFELHFSLCFFSMRPKRLGYACPRDWSTARREYFISWDLVPPCRGRQGGHVSIDSG